MISCGRREAWTCVFLPGMRKDSTEPASTATAPSVGSVESAGRSLAPPKNDGIIWKQSRSRSRSDEYLPAGGVLMPSVLSQLAHMVPRYQECVFSQRMPAVYLYWSVHLFVWARCIRQARPSVGMRFYLYIWCICLFYFHSANLARQL